MEKGLKFDDGKLDYSLVDDAAEAEMVAVLTFGAVKYERGNWAHVEGAKVRYTSAIRRHLAAWRGGEALDPETGLHHLAHAACCVHFLLGIELPALGEEDLSPLRERLDHALVTARRLREQRLARPSPRGDEPHADAGNKAPEGKATG